MMLRLAVYPSQLLGLAPLSPAEPASPANQRPEVCRQMIFSRRVLFSFLFSFVTLRQTEFRQPQDTMMDDPVSIMAVAGAARLLTLRQ